MGRGHRALEQDCQLMDVVGRHVGDVLLRSRDLKKSTVVVLPAERVTASVGAARAARGRAMRAMMQGFILGSGEQRYRIVTKMWW